MQAPHFFCPQQQYMILSLFHSNFRQLLNYRSSVCQIHTYILTYMHTYIQIDFHTTEERKKKKKKKNPANHSCPTFISFNRICQHFGLYLSRCERECVQDTFMLFSTILQIIVVFLILISYKFYQMFTKTFKFS